LVLEDEYKEQAQRGINFSFLEGKIVDKVDKLKELNPEKFKPDIVILDVNVPIKEGEEPKDNSKLSTKIVKEKFKDAAIVYYTNYWHHGYLGGVGSSPFLAKEDEIIMILKDKYSELLKIDPGFKDIADKSNPENWLRVLEVVPIVCARSIDINKLNLLSYWPKEIKEKILQIISLDNPNLVESIKRYWEEK
jgi:hypothetical protein